jgi:NAD(P)-dependent dehydrogenase (short-subunit alcohol dehydrogenase family)
MRFKDNLWALILGGSSGFGLASAKKLARHGLNLVIVHRDRRGAMHRIESEFAEIRATGVELVSFNADALDAGSRKEMVLALQRKLGERGRIRVLLHSIALGNLKLLAPVTADVGAAAEQSGEAPATSSRKERALARLAQGLGQTEPELREVVETLFADGLDGLHALVAAPAYGRHLLEEEDLAATIYNMGSSILSWTREVLQAGLFAADARILGLTSEGNRVAWRGYAAIAAAKVVLESLSRAMALELAPLGLRSNVIQAGISETPASALIPGIEEMKAQARLRNPFGRLTRPEDVAGAVFLLCQNEAAWINGALLRVDGGEHISGGSF